MKKRTRRQLPNESHSFESAMKRGSDYLQQGHAEKALPFLRKAYRLRPRDIDAAINLGGAYIFMNRHQMAVPILRLASEQAPENSKVWINLGAAFLGNPILATKEKRQRAIEAFEKALELDPVAPSVNYNIGLIHHDQGDLAAALTHFSRAISDNPLDRDARRLYERIRQIMEDGSNVDKPGENNGGTGG